MKKKLRRDTTRRLTKSLRLRLIKARLKGLTYTQITKKYNVSRSTVYYWAVLKRG